MGVINRVGAVTRMQGGTMKLGDQHPVTSTTNSWSWSIQDRILILVGAQITPSSDSSTQNLFAGWLGCKSQIDRDIQESNYQTLLLEGGGGERGWPEDAPGYRRPGLMSCDGFRSILTITIQRFVLDVDPRPDSHPQCARRQNPTPWSVVVVWCRLHSIRCG